jgi:DNA-binding response OmpR family regulator/tetratricopeptide (TPR) repeat protein
MNVDLVHLGAFRLETSSGLLSGPDGPVRLSDRERAVLVRLALDPAGIVSRTDLGGSGGSRAADMAVSRLRRRLGAEGRRIRTVRGRGYRLDVDAPAADSSGLDLGWGRIDLERNLVHVRDRVVHLAPASARLLARLARAPGRPVPRRHLARQVCPGPRAEARLDVLVHRLRRALEADPARPRFLTTVRGRGLSLLDARARPGRDAGLPPARRLYGRESELAAVDEFLRNERRVLIHGVPGIGKSALARSAALAWVKTVGGSACWVDLHGVRDAREVDGRMAIALGIEAVDRDDVVARALAARGDLLLVVDGGGSLTPVEKLERWASSAPLTRVLVSSRESCTGWPQVTPEGLDDDASRALLEEAAGRSLGAGTTRLRKRVEGNPLALEIVGHALRHAPVEDLDRRLALPLGPLRRAWEASLRNLTADERAVALAAGLFRGPFDEEDLLFVARAFGTAGVDPGALVERLKAHSVLRADGRRLRLPQAARELLAPELRRHAIAGPARRAYEACLRRILEAIVRDIPTRGGPALDSLHDRWADLGSALDTRHGPAEDVLLLARLARAASGRSPRPRRERWAVALERAAERDDLPSSVRAASLRSLHVLRWGSMSRTARRALLGRALAEASDAGERVLAAGIAAELASVVAFAGEPERAAALLRRHPLPVDAPPAEVASRLRHEGRMAVFAGRPERGIHRLRTAVELAEDHGLPLLEARCRMALGQALSVATLGREAEHHLRRAVELTETHGLPEERVRAGLRLAQHLLRLGLRDEASVLLEEALDAAVRAGLEPLEEQCAAALGFLLIGRRLPAQAVASLDRAVALARRHGGKRGLYVALCNRGLARGLAGHADGGLEDLREAASSAAAGGWYRVLGTVYRAVVELLAGHSEACLDAVGSGRLDLQDIEHPDGAGLGDALDRIDALASGANPEPIRAWVDAWTGSAEVEGVVYGIELASGARSRLAE